MDTNNNIVDRGQLNVHTTQGVNLYPIIDL
nr:MAG TPA: hypothetical protein [Caudoviricetes sp.]